MPLDSTNPTSLSSWQSLLEYADQIEYFSIQKAFDKNPKRAEELSIEWQDFYLDYSKNKVDSKILKALLNLAEESHLQDAIDKLFTGDAINETENRAVRHTALRARNKSKEVDLALRKIKGFSSEVIQGKWKGHTGKSITDVVNIGIGGSDLGPKMLTESLEFYRNHLRSHFVSNVDGDQISEVLHHLNPETTLFIVVSKSFSTQETLTNAKTAREWLVRFQNEQAVKQHFVAVTANGDRAREFGIATGSIFPVWDWVGGRFSLWSPAGLSVACAIGFKQFQELLDGAEAMDRHFRQTPFHKNMPVVMGLIGLWYTNFLDCETEAIIPYSNYLDQLVPYLQQAFMESNGKNRDRGGEKVTYQTGSVIWGATGTNAQHAFFQLLHQGTKVIPCDFIGFKKSLHGKKDHHQKLMANFFAQTEALLKGKSKAEVKQDLKNLSEEDCQKLLPYKVFDGNKPTNTLLIDQLTPASLGKLIALYEHKIFVQGVIWNIFSYDQMGVELGKELTAGILEQFERRDFDKGNQDASTKQLLKRFLEA